MFNVSVLGIVVKCIGTGLKIQKIYNITVNELNFKKMYTIILSVGIKKYFDLRLKKLVLFLVLNEYIVVSRIYSNKIKGRMIFMTKDDKV